MKIHTLPSHCLLLSALLPGLALAPRSGASSAAAWLSLARAASRAATVRAQRVWGLSFFFFAQLRLGLWRLLAAAWA